MLLHILWIILKIILILLGVVVGLGLLAVLLVLFCPIRYRVTAETEEGISKSRAQACVSWLFHGILLEFTYEDGETKSCVKIVGITYNQLRKIMKIFTKKKRKKRVFLRRSRHVRNEKKTDEGQICIEEHPESINELDNLQERQKLEKTEKSSQNTKKNKKSQFQKIKNNTSAFWGKLKGLRKISDKLKNLANTLEWWKCFLGNPRIQEALLLIKKETWSLIKHIFPTKTKGHIEFGSEDPSVTGLVLAFLGITMPLHRNCVEITPVYSGENILKGKVFLKGRIYGIMILISAIKIYFNKNVKYTISRWKRKEG